jgi:hypothetical protein
MLLLLLLLLCTCTYLMYTHIAGPELTGYAGPQHLGFYTEAHCPWNRGFGNGPHGGGGSGEMGQPRDCTVDCAYLIG